MKLLTASLSIGACLLLASSAVVLTANRHSTSPSSVSGLASWQWPSDGSIGAGEGLRCWICHR
jgi:hypothetical protein